jgi:hypothetical protein
LLAHRNRPPVRQAARFCFAYPLSHARLALCLSAPWRVYDRKIVGRRLGSITCEVIRPTQASTTGQPWSTVTVGTISASARSSIIADTTKADIQRPVHVVASANRPCFRGAKGCAIEPVRRPPGAAIVVATSCSGRPQVRFFRAAQLLTVLSCENGHCGRRIRGAIPSGHIVGRREPRRSSLDRSSAGSA